jgi:hypothetical protein
MEEPQYRFIVEALAEGESPAWIVSEFVRRWPGIALDIPDIAAYRRERLELAWRDVFDARRAEFEAAASLKDKTFRIAFLDKLAKEARLHGKYEDTRKILEQIAKEEADAYAVKPNGTQPASGGDTGSIVAITRTVIDPKQDAEHSDAAGVPAAAGAETV